MLLSERFRLDGKTAIITGGAGFLGMQYAGALVEAGAQVALFDNVSKSRLKECEFTIDPFARCCKGWHTDITKEDEVGRAIDEVLKECGTIDILINNAAMNPAVGSTESEEMFKPYDEYPIELWRREIDVNLTGQFIMLKAVSRVMMERKKGTVVNVASELSEIAYDWVDVYPPGRFKSPAYIASKTAVVGLTRAWAAFLGPHGIRVNSFSPGGMQTEKQPAEFVAKYSRKNMLGRMAQHSEYSSHILFLASEASAPMTGHNLVADGGKSAW